MKNSTLTMGRLLHKFPDTRTYRHTEDLICNDTKIGVEVELEEVMGSFKDALSPSLWNIAEDSSLRGSNAYEFKFTHPLFGKDVVRALQELDDFVGGLVGAGAPPLCSDRTSVHVHLDMRDLSAESFARLTALYCILERVLYGYCAEYRQSSIYCLPWYVATNELPRLSNQIQHCLASAKGNWHTQLSKYSGLNLGALMAFGSIEFRMHQGAWEKARLTEWINILLSLKRAAQIITVPWNEIPNELSGIDAEVLLQSIFGEALAGVLYSPKTEEYIHLGIEDANYFVSCCTLSTLEGEIKAKKATIDPAWIKFTTPNHF